MNDWLSEIEAWEEREHDDDIRRMARVIRELAEHINFYSYYEAMDKLSDDAKELLK